MDMVVITKPDERSSAERVEGGLILSTVTQVGWTATNAGITVRGDTQFEAIRNLGRVMRQRYEVDSPEWQWYTSLVNNP